MFGPVAHGVPRPDIDEAVAIANATGSGSGSNAWTTDPAEQERFVRDLAGRRRRSSTGWSTSLPAAAVRRDQASGYGRELSAHGIREFCNVKTVWIGK